MTAALPRALAWVLGALALVYLGGVLWSRRAELGRVLEIDAATLTILVLLAAASHLQRTVELEYVFRRLGASGRLVDGFMLTGASLLLNYLPLSAGSVARAVVLRQRHGLSYSAYVSALTFAAIMNVGVSAGFGLIASLFLLRQHSSAAAPFALLCGAIAGGAALAAFAPAAWAPQGAFWPARLARQLVERVASLRAGGVGLVVLAATSSLKVALSTARLWLCFRALGVDLSPLTAVLFGASAILATSVNVVPNNLGLREILLGVLTQFLGGSAFLGVAAASMERAVVLTYTVCAGSLGIHHSRRLLGSTARTPG